MSHSNRLIIGIALFSIFFLVACKKVAKDVAENVTEKTIAKEVTKEAAEEYIEKIGKKELKTLKWVDLYSALTKKMPSLAHAIDNLDMSVRGAFQKIAYHYEQDRKEGRAESPIYEEMLCACRQLQAGMSEGAVYENFGKRTGLQEYVRLCSLLMQNLKKGNSTLLQRLREEVEKAHAEQLQNSRKLGEEAATKLLLPMMMLLAVVMLMIMIPAFSSMGA